MWLKFLSGWNGVSFFLNDNLTPASDLHLFTDVTDCALGDIYGTMWFQGRFPSQILHYKEVSMALFALYPIAIAKAFVG